MAAAHAREAAVLEASHERRECTADRFRQILTVPNRRSVVNLLADGCVPAVACNDGAQLGPGSESKTSGRALPEVWEA
jgi:hypothetical protein